MPGWSTNYTLVRLPDCRTKTNHNLKEAAKISVWLLQEIFMGWLKGFIGVGVADGGIFWEIIFEISWDEHKIVWPSQIIDSKYHNFPWRIGIQTKEITAQF